MRELLRRVLPWLVLFGLVIAAGKACTASGYRVSCSCGPTERGADGGRPDGGFAVTLEPAGRP